MCTEDESAGIGFAEALHRSAAAGIEVADQTALVVRQMQWFLEHIRQSMPSIDLADFHRMLAESMRIESRIRLMSHLDAAQALAYEQLCRAGGPGNPAALADYRRDTERNLALLPGEAPR
ncbi:MAG: hypothetical protein ACRDRL_04900 [Sciscionella sp.]